MNKLVLYLLVISFLTSCKTSVVTHEVKVKNSLDIERTEVVTIRLSQLGVLPEGAYWVVKSENENVLRQLIDKDEDDVMDELVFLAELKPSEEKVFTIESSTEEQKIETDIRTYSRLVPERIDDYAWENDLVAFRTYGPEAQRLVDDGEKGGTLSSGMDCWLKRVNYSVIDKWYKKPAEGGTYHKDDGEGYDPYHVGGSRGCGGIGVWIEDSLFVSKNFVSYKKITDGPIRNIFELTYAPWAAGDALVKETKRITIDLGNQLYKIEELLEPDTALPNVTIGITLHEGKGITYADSLKGVFSYWEAIDDSEIGTGVVIDPSKFIGYEEYRTTKKDLSQLHIMAKPESTVSYFTGFGWTKAGSITTHQSWNTYLEQFALRLQHPLEVILE